MPTWLSVLLGLAFAVALMMAVAWAVERLVLAPLVNQSPLSLFMATIGVTFVLEGLGQQLFGAEVYPLDVGFPKDALFAFEGLFEGGILINRLDLWSALIAGVLVALLAFFFQSTRTGRALRAVADDHAAAQSVGIPLRWIWFVVWSVAGLVAIVAATVWGSKLGVQFSLTFVALKALPVIILGGLTSIPGAIVGGLIIGAGEKLAEVYLGPYVGGGVEAWFAYVVALVVLLVRPQGLFGERIIERI
jgi:branched-chain amino acid transport system permease protein